MEVQDNELFDDSWQTATILLSKYCSIAAGKTLKAASGALVVSIGALSTSFWAGFWSEPNQEHENRSALLGY